MPVRISVVFACTISDVLFCRFDYEATLASDKHVIWKSGGRNHAHNRTALRPQTGQTVKWEVISPRSHQPDRLSIES